MRNLITPVPELTKIDFMEMYGSSEESEILNSITSITSSTTYPSQSDTNQSYKKRSSFIKNIKKSLKRASFWMTINGSKTGDSYATKTTEICSTRNVCTESVRATQEPTNLRSSRQNDVIEKFEQSRHEEVVKMIKHMTQLNTRRNSAQLKVDQLSKEIGPRSGKKRRQNHQHFAALESRLNSMKQRLYEIDAEIREQQENKTDTLEKIEEREELELLVAEQHDILDILKNSGTRFTTYRKRHRLSSRSRGYFSSTEELSSLSNSSNSSDSLEIEKIRQAMSTPRQARRNFPVAFEVNSCDSLPSIDLMRSNLTRSEDDLSSLRHHNSLSDVIASSSMSRGDSKSSIECEKPTNDVIDPDVLAQIEMFEDFLKKTLKST